MRVGGVRRAPWFVRLSMLAPTSPNTPVIWLSMFGDVRVQNCNAATFGGRTGPMSQAG